MATVDAVISQASLAETSTDVDMATNFVSPPTPSSEASKSTCSAPHIDVEMDDDSPAPSPMIEPILMIRSEPGSEIRLSSAAARKIMFDQYQPWVLSTYGDAAKTKTITAKKYARIVALLRFTNGSDKGTSHHSMTGPSEATGSEAAKFRLWVKSKGFHLGPPAGHPEHCLINSHDLLFLPTGTDKAMDGKVHFVYKKVAMVEQFFDIIYSVHVEAAGETQLRGRAGKHCGQKRTYRAVADHYAFIPREAISKFLLYCIDCQRKNSLESGRGGHKTGAKSKHNNNNNNHHNSSNNNNNNNSKSNSCDAESENSEGHESYPSPTPSLDSLASRHSPYSAAAVAAALNGRSASMGSSSSTASTTFTPCSAMNPTAAAAALSQAVAAMQSLAAHPQVVNHPLRNALQMQQARNTFLQQATSHHNQQLFATQAALFRDAHGPQGTLLQGVVAQTALMGAHKVPDMDLSLPITSNYLKRMRALGLAAASLEHAYQQNNNPMKSMKKPRMFQASPPTDKSDTEEGEVKREQQQQQQQMCDSSSYDNWKGFVKNGNGHPVMGHQLSALLAQNGHNGGGLSPVTSEPALDVSGQDDSCSIGAKEEDEDDDDDEDLREDRMDANGGGDPEKLKAFNMFVRLFVDENLDRCMPISKQPKEKVQAIIDSCTRQFPEFATRARKRIRTYLKSCRRTKRTREQAGLDMSDCRPTPPHLTSVQAEQLLARACENESDNAKRMRMGLEPISQPMPICTTQPNLVDVLASCSTMSMAQNQHLFPNMSALNPIDMKSSMNGTGTGEKQLKTEYKPEQLASLLQAAASQPVPVMMTSSSAGSSPHITSTMASCLPQSPLLPSTFPGLNGATLYRPPFQSAPTFPQNAAILQQQQQSSSQNGPTLESLKKTPLLNHKLNQTEISAVRQLVTGYRESAAFLLRSADELEHLLQIQPKL